MGDGITTLIIQPDAPCTCLSLLSDARCIDRRWLITPPTSLFDYVSAVVEASAVLLKRTGLRPSRVAVVSEAVRGDGGVRRDDSALLSEHLPTLVNEVADCVGAGKDMRSAVTRCAAIGWAHARFGVGGQLGDHAHVGLGRDGGALIIDGVLAGSSVAHLPVDPSGPPCQCGRRGCLAAFTSTAALQRMEALFELDGLRPSAGPRDDGLPIHLAVRSLRDHCPLATDILTSAGLAIGLAVSGLLNAADLRDVVVHAAPQVWKVAEPTVRRTVERHTFDATREGLRFHLATPSAEAACIGAADLCRLNPTGCALEPKPLVARPN